MNKIPVINQIIKNKRKELRITQKEFADLLDRSLATVKKYDTGSQIPLDTLTLITSKLNLDLIDLFIKQELENKKNNTDYYSYLVKKYVKVIPYFEKEKEKETIKNRLFDIFVFYYSNKNILLDEVRYFNNKYYIKGSNEETLNIFSESQATELTEHIKDYIDYFIFKCQKENLNK